MYANKSRKRTWRGLMNCLPPTKVKKGNFDSRASESTGYFGHLPKEVLIHISRKMKIPISQVYGGNVLRPVSSGAEGRHILRSCQGTACHVRGAGPVLKENERTNFVNDKDVPTRPQVTAETVACIGCCGLAPRIMIDDETYGRLTPEAVKGIIEKYSD